MTKADNLEQGKLSSEDAIEQFVAKVGERVRAARKQKAISRRVLSEQSGVSQRYLAQLESGSGNISIALLYQIAEALGHSPSWFLGEENPWNSDIHQLVQYYKLASSGQKRRAFQELEPSFGLSNKGRRICLIGLRGAGKSTLGKLMADELSLEFIELNTLIEEQSGIPVGEVMALYGEEGYRQLERQALDTICETKTAVVLAVSGGIVSEGETYNQLLRTFHTIWIKASPVEHMERVREQGDVRPMAGNPKAMDELKSILTNRENLYSQADFMIDTSHRSIEESKANLLQIINQF